MKIFSVSFRVFDMAGSFLRRICKWTGGESAGKVALQLLVKHVQSLLFSALRLFIFFLSFAGAWKFSGVLKARGLWVKSCVSVFKSLFQRAPERRVHLSSSCRKTLNYAKVAKDIQVYSYIRFPGQLMSYPAQANQPTLTDPFLIWVAGQMRLNFISQHRNALSCFWPPQKRGNKRGHSLGTLGHVLPTNTPTHTHWDYTTCGQQPKELSGNENEFQAATRTAHLPLFLNSGFLC